MKKLLLCAALGVVTLGAKCKDPLDAGIDLALVEVTDFGGIFQASDGMVVELSGSTAKIRSLGSSVYTNKPSVGDSYMVGMEDQGGGTYRGYLMTKSGLLSNGHTIHISETGLTTDSDQPGAQSMTRTSSRTGGNFAGGWRRVSDTYDTDMQVGIPGQGPSRVYLCSLKPSVQLVRGNVMADGATIKWDLEFNVPDYVMQSAGSGMQLYVPSAGLVGGTYERANWRNGSCGLSY